MLVSAMHITAGVWINDNEPGIWQDAMDMLEELAPEGPDYRHHRTGEDNGHAHLKNLLTHHQVILPITNGRLDLGPGRPCSIWSSTRQEQESDPQDDRGIGAAAEQSLPGYLCFGFGFGLAVALWVGFDAGAIRTDFMTSPLSILLTTSMP